MKKQRYRRLQRRELLPHERNGARLNPQASGSAMEEMLQRAGFVYLGLAGSDVRQAVVRIGEKLYG